MVWVALGTLTDKGAATCVVLERQAIADKFTPSSQAGAT
jgi:hypothetical protein